VSDLESRILTLYSWGE